jgi:hypothetical protein
VQLAILFLMICQRYFIEILSADGINDVSADVHADLFVGDVLRVLGGDDDR